MSQPNELPDEIPIEEEAAIHWTVFRREIITGKVRLEEIACVEAIAPVPAILLAAEQHPTKAVGVPLIALPEGGLHGEYVSLRTIASLKKSK